MSFRGNVMRFLAAGLGAGLVAGCSPDTGAVGGGENNSTDGWQALSTAAPAWATKGQMVAPLAATQPVHVQVHLAMHNATQAVADLKAMSTPKDPMFRKFYTPNQFATKYGPTQADVQAVTQHLASKGMVVTYIPKNRAYVEATGTAKAASAAFGAQLGTFKVGAETRFAPMTQPKMPPQVASRVLGVLGLSSPVVMGQKKVNVGGIKHKNVAHMINPKDGPGPTQCSEWYGSMADSADIAYPGITNLAFGPCPYRPAQIRTAYGFNQLIRRGQDGTGVSVAIVDAYMSPTLLQDAQTYAANNDPDYPLLASQFSAQMAPGTPSEVDPGWFGEQSLDVEAVHAMAPGANIVYVGAQSPTDIDLSGAINFIIDNQLADIISNSWGSMEAQPNDFVVFHSMATQAGLLGVGIYFSSGDNGDEAQNNFGSPSADFPASLDNVTAVGGTSLAFNQQGQVLWQLGWETGASWATQIPVTNSAGAALTCTTDADCGAGNTCVSNACVTNTWDPPSPGQFVFGAGGGTSMVYEQPWYQAGVVPDALANLPGAPARVVPDVSALADPITGFLVGMTDPFAGGYVEQAIGGTSLSCPLFAASMALVEQKAGYPIGFANPALYYASAAGGMTDIAPSATPQAVAVIPGIVTTFDYAGQTIQTAVGYDNVTGLGVPNGQAFIDSLIF